MNIDSYFCEICTEVGAGVTQRKCTLSRWIGLYSEKGPSKTTLPGLAGPAAVGFSCRRCFVLCSPSLRPTALLPFSHYTHPRALHDHVRLREVGLHTRRRQHHDAQEATAPKKRESPQAAMQGIQPAGAWSFFRFALARDPYKSLPFSLFLRPISPFTCGKTAGLTTGRSWCGRLL